MSEIFLKTVNLSISAGWLVLAVLLFRLLLRKAPRWSHVLLWGLVAVRLLFPFSIESVLSLVPSAETIPLDIAMDITPAIHSGVEIINSAVNPVLSQSNTPMPGDSVNPLQISIAVLANLWVLGCLAMLLYAGISCLSLKRRLRTAVLLRDNIFQCENVDSPFVLGVIRPKMYLPYTLNSEELNHVTAHEQAHIRRKDHLWKPLGYLLLSIHWFNPLMWLAYILLCRDIELACDEKVIAGLDNAQRADYSQALLACSVRHRRIAACPLAFGEVSVKRRIRSILNYRKPAFWLVLAAVVICLVAAVCFLTDPVGEEALHYWVESYLTTGEPAEVTKAFNRDRSSLSIAVKYESTSGPTEIQLLFAYKNNDAQEWISGAPVTLGLGEMTYFSVPAESYYAFTARLLRGNGGYVTFRFTEGSVAVSDPRPVVEWFDFSKTPEQVQWTGAMQCSIEQFPGTIFKYNGHEILASESWEDSPQADDDVLITGMPIEKAYFCDLTGDGKPEICAQVSYGSGMIDSHIVIFDYAAGISYKLWDRGYHDYDLRLENGALYADKRVYNSSSLTASGKLVFENGSIRIKGESRDASSLLIAEILEIHDDYFLVEPVEGSWELSSASRFQVPIRYMSPSPEPRIGDILQIEYDGKILETYPAQLGEIYHMALERTNTQAVTLIPTDTQLTGIQAGMLLVPMDGSVYRYRLAEGASEDITADTLLFTFTEETHIEGIVWGVYSLKEYPDKTALLMRSGTNSAWLCTYEPPARCGDMELSSAIGAGYVVMEDGFVTHGQDIWQKFFGQVLQGNRASVTVAQYATLDEARCTAEYAEVFRQDYPNLQLYGLQYDGNEYTLSFQSGDRAETRTYEYLMVYNTGTEGNREYILTHDDTVTWEQLTKGLYSAHFDDYIDHFTVCREKKP